MNLFLLIYAKEIVQAEIGLPDERTEIKFWYDFSEERSFFGDGSGVLEIVSSLTSSKIMWPSLGDGSSFLAFSINFREIFPIFWIFGCLICFEWEGKRDANIYTAPADGGNRYWSKSSYHEKSVSFQAISRKAWSSFIDRRWWCFLWWFITFKKTTRWQFPLILSSNTLNFSITNKAGSSLNKINLK